MILQDPELFASFKKRVKDTSALAPDLQEQHIILDTYSGFDMSQVRILLSMHWPAAVTALCMAVVAAYSALHNHHAVTMRGLYKPQWRCFFQGPLPHRADRVQAAEERSLACYVAPVSWEQSSSGQPLLVASGGLLRAAHA